MNNFNKAVETAQEVTIKNNGHIPQIMAFGSISNSIMAFADFPIDFNDKMRLMAGAGGKLAETQLQEKSLGELEDVIFISEAWMKTAKKGEQVQLPVRDNPDRIEVLIIIGRNLKEDIDSHAYFKMIRDKKTDKVIKLESMTKEIKKLYSEADIEQSKIDSPIVNAFIYGYKTMTERLSKQS